MVTGDSKTRSGVLEADTTISFKAVADSRWHEAGLEMPYWADIEKGGPRTAHIEAVTGG